ncbi:MAG: hypothetical protein V5A64_04460 [Candidatus Thermoplasmatota archaeon]
MMKEEKTSIDEMVDKVISRHEKKNTELERDEEDMPFRYATEEELQGELGLDQETPVSVKTTEKKSLIEFPDDTVSVMGDSVKIEEIISKHVKNREQSE